jgi:hypothetical protein
MPSDQSEVIGFIETVKFDGVVSLCLALKSFNLNFTLPEAGMSPDVRAVAISLTGKSINILDFSNEEVVAWPYIEKISKISDAPMLANEPEFTKFSLNAFVIVLSFVAKNLLIDIIL